MAELKVIQEGTGDEVLPVRQDFSRAEKASGEE
jgi:hypothetical protein